jgi:hypothetical protein
MTKAKGETNLVSPFPYSASCSSNSNPTRSNSSKNSAVSSSSVLEDCWGEGIVSSIGRTSFVKSALYALLPRNCCICWATVFVYDANKEWARF